MLNGADTGMNMTVGVLSLTCSSVSLSGKALAAGVLLCFQEPLLVASAMLPTKRDGVIFNHADNRSHRSPDDTGTN